MNKKKQLLLIVAIGLLAGPIAAQADFAFELVDHPGAQRTQVFGINDRGDAVGHGIIADDAVLPFVYASKKGTFTDIAHLAGVDETALLGNRDSGVIVGNVRNGSTTSGFIRDKNGDFTVLSHPDALSFTSFRGTNNKGLVTGFRFRLDFGGTVVSFIYDPKSDTFTDIIPPSDHVQSIAQGINSKGEAVGSAFFLSTNDPCNSGAPTFFVRYGWLRATNGSVTYFRVNGLRTAARGINDSGTVVGFVFNPNDGTTKGFKVELDGSQCQAITVAAGDLLEFPGFISLFPASINNSGIISGGVRNVINHGFIARPE